MFGTTELLVILFIIIIVFGASKLPQLGDALGRSISNFRKAVKEGREDQEAGGTESAQQSGISESSESGDSPKDA